MALSHPCAKLAVVVIGAEDLVQRLRGNESDRRPVDPGLAGGLREWLEDHLSVAAGPLDPSAVVRVTKDTLTQVLVCEAHLVASRAAGRELTVELARGKLVDALFRQWVTCGSSADPFDDALHALAVSGDLEVADFVGALPEGGRDELESEVVSQAERITKQWPAINGSWMPRTQERLNAPVCGGRVVLSGVVDLVLGVPASERSSICIVEVKSGRRRLEHRADLHFYSLLETLRSGAPPFCAATYYAGKGELDVEPIGEEVLVAALQRVLTGAERLCRIAAGAEPVSTPNPLCAWCAGLSSCLPGQERAGTDVPRKGRLPEEFGYMGGDR